MTDQFPIIPPPELVQQREDDILNERENIDVVLDCTWKDGYRAGADAELEACCEWFQELYKSGDVLRAARRPKPPTLNSIALQMLGTIERDAHYLPEITDTIRKALEALPND